MAKKKTEEVEETTAEVLETEATEETGAESNEVSAQADSDETETMEAGEAQESEEKPKKAVKKAKAEDGETAEEPSIVESVLETVASAIGTAAGAVASRVGNLVSTISGDSDESETAKKGGKRAEKVGVVASDKMTKTVTVRVDRLVKHPVYRKYIKRRKKFMAHDDLGAQIGDKVRIIETRPLSAKKRWRVVEIIQKAER